MKILITLLLLFSSVLTFAQSNSWEYPTRNEETFLPFFADLPKTYDIVHALTCYSPDYNPSLLGICCGTFSSTLDSNNRVTLNNKEYFVLDQDFPSSNEQIYIREDLQTSVIYRYYPSLDTEIVWCDMRLSIGDTFVLPHIENVNSIAQNSYWEYAYIADEYMIVDTVFYDNFGRKNIYFSKNPILNYSYYEFEGRIQMRFIEGVGPTYGPAGFIYHGEPFLGALLCVHLSNNDSLIYMAHPDLGCYQYGVGIDAYEEESLLLYPNPANNNIHLHFDSEQVRNGRCIISNVSGLVVKMVQCNENDTDISISDLPSGIYFLRYEDEKGYTVKKFVKN